MNSCLIIKRKDSKKCHIRNYKRSLKHGKSRRVASVVCWLKNVTFITLLLFVCLLMMPLVACKDKVEDVVEVETQERCTYNSLKNKQGLANWVYSKTRNMSMNQCLRAVEVSFEGDEPYMVLAIIIYEAGGDPAFISSAGAIGHGGIMPGNLNSLIKAGIIKKDVRELFEPDTNIRATQFMLTQKYNLAKKDKNKPKDWSIIAWTMRLYRGWDRSTPKAMKEDLRKLNNYTNKILNAYWELKEINNENENPA